MAAKTCSHRYGTKLRHCHPMYNKKLSNHLRLKQFTVGAVSGSAYCCGGVLCAACTSGRYGKNCGEPCQCSGSQCHPETGECVCEAGRLGADCSQGHSNAHRPMLYSLQSRAYCNRPGGCRTNNFANALRQLILRKIIKFHPNRCQTLRLQCTKFDFRCFGSYGALEHWGM